AEGVVESEGEAVLALAARPDRDPVLPLRFGAAAAQAGVPVSLHAVRRLAAQAKPLPVPWPAEAREQLVTLLGAGEPTVVVWEAMEAEGLITRLLPDWERVRCRPQRNPVHTWTVDRHLVETAVRASALTRRVSRPDLLLMAALLHDIGKGWPGDHAVAGETIARDVAQRMGFDARDVTVLGVLVRHHLLLIDTATRRDLDDPATVRSVAEAVGSPGTLEILHALTEADALATGPAAWSAWRGSLVADLVARVASVLRGAAPPASEAEIPSTEQERRAVEALRTGEPVLALHARQEEDVVGVELVVAVPDQPGVLPAVAGVLALHRLTVRAADLRSLELPDRLGEVLVLRWRVAAEYGALPEGARLRTDLIRALDGSLDVPAKLADREAAYPRRRGVVPPPPRVTVVPDVSSLATVLEVRAPDAVGLLHRIGRALESARVRVRSAHVSTLGANAVDSLYVVDPDGKPLTAPAATALAATLEAALR
ncbi:ACT domain-containing protein, partial [Streptomyces goshikiensis]